MSDFDKATVQGVYRLLLDEYPHDGGVVVWRDPDEGHRVVLDNPKPTPTGTRTERISVSVLPPVMGLYNRDGQIAWYELANPACFDQLIADVRAYFTATG